MFITASLISCTDNATTDSPTTDGTPTDRDTTDGATFVIDEPVAYQVFQRNNQNASTVPLNGEIAKPASSTVTIKARYFLSRQPANPGEDWIPLSQTDARFFGDIVIPAGGWYTIEVAAFGSNDTIQGTASVEKVGVGEVFVTAGQSNSASFGTSSFSPVDEVAAWNDGKTVWQHGADPQPVVDDGWGGDGGSPWSRLGNLLYDELGVPIGFIACGEGRSSVLDWTPSQENGLYSRLVRALQIAENNGVRAILWHQGETDVVEQTPAAVYAENLSEVISSIRNDTGENVPFGIAKASFLCCYEPEDQSQVREGQQTVIDFTENVFPGPDTDAIGVEYRTEGQAHFNDEGLWLHAEGWQEALDNAFFD